MDRLIFTTLSAAVAKGPVAVYHNDGDEYDDNYQDDLGPEEHRLLRRRRRRRRRRQRERRARRLLASGLERWQVRELEDDVRRAERVLRRRPPRPQTFAMGDLVFSCVGILGVMSGAFVAGWAGWAALIAGAVILMLEAGLIWHEDGEHRGAEEKRADAEETQARVRAVLERTGNADLLPLQDW